MPLEADQGSQRIIKIRLRDKTTAVAQAKKSAPVYKYPEDEDANTEREVGDIGVGTDMNQEWRADIEASTEMSYSSGNAYVTKRVEEPAKKNSKTYRQSRNSLSIASQTKIQKPFCSIGSEVTLRAVEEWTCPPREGLCILDPHNKHGGRVIYHENKDPLLSKFGKNTHSRCITSNAVQPSESNTTVPASTGPLQVKFR
ncbi:hypothetical protein EDD85DRAFT_791012 [Armillaria nabsnona]|nr:hypothetical protein EDD85DRAFT_791012 [Armillaria nabsnona]